MDATRDELARLMNALMRFLREANRAAAQTPDQTRIGMLQLLMRSGPIGALDIASEMDLPPSSVIRELRTLEESQLATVAEDHGRGGFVASATAEAGEELRHVADAGCDMLAAVIHQWCAGDVRQMTEYVSRLSDDWVAFRQASARKVQSRTTSL